MQQEGRQCNLTPNDAQLDLRTFMHSTRNGGHVTPILYGEYSDLKQQYGMDIAKKIIRFRLSHFPELLAVATEEGLLEDSQCRQVEAFDVFYDAGRYKAAKAKLTTYQRDLPAESAEYKSYEGPDDMRVSYSISFIYKYMFNVS